MNSILSEKLPKDLVNLISEYLIPKAPTEEEKDLRTTHIMLGMWNCFCYLCKKRSFRVIPIDRQWLSLRGLPDITWIPIPVCPECIGNDLTITIPGMGEKVREDLTVEHFKTKAEVKRFINTIKRVKLYPAFVGATYPISKGFGCFDFFMSLAKRGGYNTDAIHYFGLKVGRHGFVHLVYKENENDKFFQLSLKRCTQGMRKK